MILRKATREDVPAIVRMLADDAMAHDANNFILIAESGGEIVGTLQLTFIAGLSRKGARRAQIEAVRVSSRHRGGGFGQQMIEAAIDLARKEGCSIVQLTTDKKRSDAHRFYERLGFVATHEGMKLELD